MVSLQTLIITSLIMTVIGYLVGYFIGTLSATSGSDESHSHYSEGGD